MDRVRQRHRLVIPGRLSDKSPRTAGFTLVEVLVTLAVTGIFMIMVSGLVLTTTRVAKQQQARTSQRSSSRFALDQVVTDLSSIGGRLPFIPGFDAAGTLNNVGDEDVADLGTDTFTTMHARFGPRTGIRNLAGDMANGTMQLTFHTTDTVGDNPICATADSCIAAFVAEYGGDEDYLLVGEGANFWIVRITAAPTVTLGALGGINISFEGVQDNTGGASFLLGDDVTGLSVNSYRIFGEQLQVKRGFLNGPGDFFTLADNIEDMQLAFLLADGTYVGDGLPNPMDDVRGTVVSLVTVDPIDMGVGASMFTRPAVEDHAEGATADRRRRTVIRQMAWSRNLG